MPQTTDSSASAYCDAPTFFVYYAYQLAGDMLRPYPEAPRPSYLAMIDPNNPACQRLLVFLNKGAGEIESACSVSSRYSPADLNSLTGVSRALLQQINAARAMWAIYQKLKPGTGRPEDVPGAMESAKALEDLRNGERIFSFVESAEAGLPSVQSPQTRQLLTGYVIGRARRLFPNYGADYNNFRGSGG